jgi:hypothetical protein
MASSDDNHWLIGVGILAIGVWLGVTQLGEMRSAQDDVRGATPYPATLLSVTEPKCSGSKTKTCRFEAVARIKSSGATIERPAFAGRYSSLRDANDARASHFIGAPTTVYRLPDTRGEHSYYTAPAFEQLRRDSTLGGNLLYIFCALMIFAVGAGKLFGFFNRR